MDAIRLSTCTKLKQGQLLMQRYMYCWDMRGKYVQQGEECKRKSVILAKRMKVHAAQCDNCTPNDANFYGLEV